MISVKLNVIGGKHSGQVIPLDRKKFLIGREQDCQLRPNSELVSRHHCIFTVDDFSVRVRDLGSTNGTLVNGERIRKEVVLQPGDHVVVGNLEFDVKIDELAQNAPAESVPVDKGETVVAGGPGSDTLTEMKPIGLPVGSETGEQPAIAATPAAPEVSAVAETQPATTETQPAATETQPAATETQPAAPVAPPQPGPGDTTVISQPMMMPGQAPYQPMMPQMGYPPMYGGGYPYPGMPQQPMQMYPQQGYPGGVMPGYPQQPATPEAAAVEEAGPATPNAQSEVSLPDPSETGAKDAPPPKPETAEDSDAPQDEPSNKSAAAIIQQHMQRRPGS